eukprot:751796-Amphidinium_carterae.2
MGLRGHDMSINATAMSLHGYFAADGVSAGRGQEGPWESSSARSGKDKATQHLVIKPALRRAASILACQARHALEIAEEGCHGPSSASPPP